MFTQGLSNRFAQDMLLGWNKYPKVRPAANWGLPDHLADPLVQKGKLTLPPGLVIPYVEGKDLRKLLFYDYQSNRPQPCFALPGGSTEPMILGGPSSAIAVVFNVIHGLYVHQELHGKIRVIIPHEPQSPDNATVTQISLSDTCLVFPDSITGIGHPWPDHIDGSLCHTYDKAEDIARMITDALMK